MVMQPEQVLKQIRSKIKRKWKISFWAAIFFGLFAHIYKFTNFIPNWDSLLNLYTNQDKLDLGRCFLVIACAPSSYYDLPWINGIVSSAYIAGASICVSELFQIKKTISLVLISGLMVTFPTVTSTMAYNYTADGYFLALLCMCVAVLLIVRFQKGCIPAIFLMAFGMGTYQAYITFTMALILIYLIDQLLFHKINQKQYWSMVVRFGITGVLSGIVYYFSIKCRLVMSGITLSEYQSINEAFSLHRIQFFYGILRAGYQFLTYFFDFSQGVNLFLVLNIVLWLMLFIFFLMAFRLEKTVSEPWRMILILMCIAALPFASYALYFADTTLNYHNLMVMCLCLIYLLPVFFYERLFGLSEKTALIKQWSILGFSILTIFNFTLLANISYQNMYMAYEKSYSVIVRLADRIEQFPGADKCKKIAVFGCLPGSESISINFPPDMTGITDDYIIREQDTMMHENVTQAMLNDYCGFTYKDTTKKEVQEIRKKKEFRQMGYWPERNSIAIIDDTLVIQFGDENNE